MTGSGVVNGDTTITFIPIENSSLQGSRQIAPSSPSTKLTVSQLRFHQPLLDHSSAKSPLTFGQQVRVPTHSPLVDRMPVANMDPVAAPLPLFQSHNPTGATARDGASAQGGTAASKAAAAPNTSPVGARTPSRVSARAGASSKRAADRGGDNSRKQARLTGVAHR